MPLYDFQCLVCSKEFEGVSTIEGRTEVKCECGGATKRLIVGSTTHIFKAGWWEDIAKEPIYISSKKQLREECEKHDCYAVCLEPPISKRGRNERIKERKDHDIVPRELLQDFH